MEVNTEGKGETVLLVEDEEQLLELLVMLLEENGYCILTASDGEAAVETFRQHSHEVAVVLSDLGLPKLGGWEAFLQMKTINPRVKAILASGYFDPELKQEIIKSGAKLFVQKPYQPLEVLMKIRQLIDSAD
ncbi:MAG TPA: response regulator [Bacteroidota bacterium]|nr:response regulator [Bacteroidota bacterium]